MSMAEMSLFEAVVRTAVAAFSIFLFFVAAVAYRRRSSSRMRWVLGAFAIFLVEGVILLVEVFVQDTTVTGSVFYVFQFTELLVLSVAVLKR
jgi:cell shape-determining protein MreD